MHAEMYDTLMSTTLRGTTKSRPSLHSVQFIETESATELHSRTRPQTRGSKLQAVLSIYRISGKAIHTPIPRPVSAASLHQLHPRMRPRLEEHVLEVAPSLRTPMPSHGTHQGTQVGQHLDKYAISVTGQCDLTATRC